MINKYRSIFKILFYNLIIVIISLTLVGVIFSAKRNSYGVFFSENINSFDLPKRMNRENQIQTINKFLNKEINKPTNSESEYIYKSNEDYICRNNYLNYFRNNSKYSFTLPTNFSYQLNNISIENYDTPSLLFIGHHEPKTKSINITKCKNNWLVQF